MNEYLWMLLFWSIGSLSGFAMALSIKVSKPCDCQRCHSKQRRKYQFPMMPLDQNKKPVPDGD